MGYLATVNAPQTVPGVDEALDLAAAQAASGRRTALVPPRGRPGRCSAEAMVDLLDRVAGRPWARSVDLTVSLPGLAGPLATDALPGGTGAARSDAVVLDRARDVALAARNAGAHLTVDGGDLPVDRVLGLLRELRKDFPDTGVVVRAALRRSEGDCRALAHEGSRVRLVPGPRAARVVGPDEAHRPGLAREAALVRCAAVLLAGEGEPAVAADDPLVARIACAVAAREARGRGGWELVTTLDRHGEPRRAATDDGEAVRVLVPWRA